MYNKETQPLEWVLDRIFISEEEINTAKGWIQKLGLDSCIEKLAWIAGLNPKLHSEDIQKLKKINASELGYEVAQSILSKVSKVSNSLEKSTAAKVLGELVQYTGLDISETIKDYKPAFLGDYLVGFKRFKARHKVSNKDFFKSMCPGYLMDVAKEFVSAPQVAKRQLLLSKGTDSSEMLKCTLVFNQHHPHYGRRKKRLLALMVDYGLVTDKRTIAGFFNAEDQSGMRVKSKGSKRNHVALLFHKLLEEAILLKVGGKGHWKTLETCFVDEYGKSLSGSFSKLLSKLQREKDKNESVFIDIEQIIDEFKK